MIVDIGGGTTEVAVIALAGVVYSKSVRVGGNMMDDAILQHIKQKYNLLIGESFAEHIKTTIGNAVMSDKMKRMEVKGRDLVSGFPKIVEVDAAEVNKALSDLLETILQTVKTALEQIPPELAGDIMDRGIVLAGGGALLKNFDRLLAEETGLPISIADDPLTCVVMGSGKALDSIDILKQVMI